jgi:hypothetical protein
MKPIDYAKALGVGALLLALNLLLTTIVITLYAFLVAPGHDQAFYNAKALDIAKWSAPIGGALLTFIAGWLLAKRKPERNGLAFIAACWVAYILIDAASALPMGGFMTLVNPVFAIHALASLAAGLAGAALARRKL